MNPLRTLAVGLAAVVAMTLTIAPSYAERPDAATRAERRLNALHCDAGRADGRIDQHTRSAIVRFQSRVGIRQSARLDARTRKRLYAEDAPRCDVRPVPAGSGQGRRIVISQRQNWVWLVGPGGHAVVQGGMVDNTGVLRPGSHATGSYCGRSARIKLNQATSGDVWLDNFVRFAPCGIGFHRIPRYQSNGQQMHADWILGTNMATSHGCIRLSQELSLKVWDFTTRRTPVRVL
jgi:peptidoglycan hydrolase-like protein with peptidoglycan-binding domain